MGAGSSPSSLFPAPTSQDLSKETIVGTPKPGTYARGDVTRVASTPSAAVNLTRDGWTLVKEERPSKAASDSQKPKSTEN